MVKPTKLSDTARGVLSAAAAHDDGLALPPDHLPAAAQRAVVRSLLKAGLLEERPADDDQHAWRTAEDGGRAVLRITDAGRRAVPGEPNAEVTTVDPPTAAQDTGAAAETTNVQQNGPASPTGAECAPTAPLQPTKGRQSLREATLAVLAAWDDTAEGRPALPDAMDALRAVLAGGRAARAPSGAPRPPRTDTKQAAVLAMLRRPEGASGPAMAEATGWAPHTIRGFLAGLAKRGHTLTVLDRVRQVGPGKEGAKGSYTVYRIVEAS